MADYTIATDQVGVYEIPLIAGNTTTVAITRRGGYISNTVQVAVHDASMPVYARVGSAVSIKDPASSVVLAGTWLDMRTPYGDNNDATISLISAADATVSVARS